MSLHINHLLLKIKTTEGNYGLQIPFKDGLVIIRADNTSGKSTCIQSIIYALGLERMLSPKKEVPLPPAMTNLLEDNGKEIQVTESEVLLEIRNDNGDSLTIQRTVKGNRDNRLITTWNGPAISEPQTEYQQQDFYVRDPGSATKSRGFHPYLASFLGIELPEVRTYDGNVVPLYLECIFPLMIVEQKHGWSGIQSTIPKYYRIKDVDKRAIEFLAGLEAYGIAVEKQKIKQEKKELENQWSSLISKCKAIVQPLNATIHSIPSLKSWPNSADTYVEVYRNKETLPLEIAIKKDMELLSNLKKKEICNVKNTIPDIPKKISESKEKLADREYVLKNLFDEFEAEKNELEAINQRINALKEDLRRNQDIAKLRKFGSKENINMISDTCPVCHQQISDTLIPEIEYEEPMSIEDNINFIKSQINIFQKMKENSLYVIASKEKKLKSMQNEVGEISSHIRALKQNMISDERLPSISELENRIKLEEKIKFEKEIQEDFELTVEEFYDLFDDYSAILQKEKSLPKDGLSTSDKNKLDRLTELFKEQLKQYGFTSFDPKLVEIANDDYKPSREGFNLGFDLSASDHIRTIWAYLHGLLELSRDNRTNHLGILIFDEPRQQETSNLSFAELLKRASQAGKFQQQVIFATSEDENRIKEIMTDLPHEFHDFKGKMITKMN